MQRTSEIASTADIAAVIDYCTVTFSTYDTDLRVKRYAEAIKDAGAARVDAIALTTDTDTTKAAIGTNRGVTVYYAQTKRHGEKTRSGYSCNLIRFFARATIILLRNHFRRRYKVIHIHNLPDFLVFIAWLPKLMGAKIILDIHDIMPELYCERFKKPITSNLAKTLFMLEKWSLHFADYVIVANDLWRDKLVARANIKPDRCSTILNYPNLAFFKNIPFNPLRNEIRLLYPGHLSHHHGIDIAVRAFARVKRLFPEARFDIYARTYVQEYRARLEKMIDELELRKSLVIHPAITPEDIPKMYADATIGVIPKRGGLFASEAFSSKVFDFMAAGLPIVASRTTIDEYYFSDEMIQFFEPDNVDDMAEKIISLFNDPIRRKTLSENGLKFASSNNWEDKKQNYLDIVFQLLEK